MAIPVHRRLKGYLDALPKDALLFVVDDAGRPVEERAFGKEFRAGLDTADLEQLYSTGCGTRLPALSRNSGCSAHEIQAITGHRTLQMWPNYTKTTRQKASGVGRD